MTEIILVRHGQANSHATDADSYDRLSGLGHDQARWLGQHLAGTNAQFDHVITGALRRHVETARAMGYAVTHRDGRLDELDYWALSRALEEAHGLPAPDGPESFATHLPEALRHWAEATIAGAPERFEEFAARVTAALHDLAALRGRILVITSGGVIGMAMRHVLDLSTAATAQVMLQVMNSSLHRFDLVRDRLHLSTFNATPHLDLPGRAHARTFI